ncbi:MAG: hypothetical protein LBS94_05315, partial [Prevotellaceae bacterium]|nr:hypothetical protein [Prevotellaceae bacterium]
MKSVAPFSFNLRQENLENRESGRLSGGCPSEIGGFGTDRLHPILLHQGESTNCGYYFVLIRLWDLDQWIRFYDSNVGLIDL